MTESGLVIVVTTVGAMTDAERIASAMVEQRLAACVNILPAVTSVYRWKGSVVKEGEIVLLLKTTREGLPVLRDALLAAHPYEVPEFVVLGIAEASEAYARWLRDAL